VLIWKGVADDDVAGYFCFCKLNNKVLVGIVLYDTIGSLGLRDVLKHCTKLRKYHWLVQEVFL